MILLRNDDLEKLHAVKQILEKEFKSHYTTDQLAQKVGINNCKLKYGFKYLFDTGPYKFLTAVRIEKAKEILECTEHPIKYIAVSVGIPDVPTFIKSFKRLTGLSPAEWRRSKRTPMYEVVI
jgi:AraC-like DNA-binding protein